MKKFCVLVVMAALVVVSCKRPQPDAFASFIPRPAPAWKLSKVDGGELSSAELKGKVVLVVFWATWCPPCNEEIPGLIELQAKHAQDGLAIVGVSVNQEGAEVVKRFVEDKKINYAVVMDDGNVAPLFGQFDGIPTAFIVDRQGMIRSMDVGYVPAEVQEDRIKLLLAAK